jgi:hypothetical protein
MGEVEGGEEKNHIPVKIRVLAFETVVRHLTN